MKLHQATVELARNLREAARSASGLQAAIGQIASISGLKADHPLLQETQAIDQLTQALVACNHLADAIACELQNDTKDDVSGITKPALTSLQRVAVGHNNDGDCEFF